MRRGLHIAAVVAVLSAVCAAPTPGGAQGIGTYTGVAAADAYRATVEIPGFLIIEQFVDGGGPSAQASVDSSGGSTAFAGAPDPGQVVVSLPGLVSILTGIPIPFSVPVYTSSQHPTVPRDTIDQPGYHVRAESEARRSEASAVIGERSQGVTAGSYAESSVEYLDDGTVVATAESGIARLQLGVLEIAGFTSSAKVTRKPNEEPEREYSMEIARISLAGIPILYDGDGLSIGGDNIVGELLGKTLTDLFSTLGISIELLEATENEDGVVAPGLKIGFGLPIEQISSEAMASLVLGQTSAAATTRSFPLPDFEAPDLEGTTAPPPAPPSTPAPVASPAVTPPPPAPSAAPVEVAAPEPAPAPVAVSPVSSVVPLRLEGTSFYLVLLGAATLLVVVSRAFTSSRRVRWNS